ncbi:MAG TPA: efflux RND transporter periplasmic adaptor subunit [Alphaproteobacteria bacterium]|nr:efflux RND transporter periplasmic adaptor subunit [Alphaproteobacteria bacterium]
MPNKQTINKKRPILFFIFLIAIFIIGVVILKIPSKEKDEDGKTKTVAVSKVIRTDLSQTITLSAELVPFTEATLYAKVPGYLKEIKVDIGDQVKTGEILAILDVPELVNIVAKNKAALDQAKLDFTRITGVSKKHPELIAQDTVDKMTEAYEIAKASYEHSQTMFNYSVITAPFDGVITARFVDEGAMIQEGTNTHTQAIPLVHIADNTKFRLTFPVPESNVSLVKPGDQVDIKILSMNKSLKAPIARIANKVTTETRTMETQVDVYNNAELNLTPGMYASVTLHLKEKKDALALPVPAVEIALAPNVWLINKNDEIEERPVTLGIQTPDRVEILKGLKERDLVVFGNRNALSVGMKIKPKLIEASQITKEN